MSHTHIALTDQIYFTLVYVRKNGLEPGKTTGRQNLSFLCFISMYFHHNHWLKQSATIKIYVFIVWAAMYKWQVSNFFNVTLCQTLSRVAFLSLSNKHPWSHMMNALTHIIVELHAYKIPKIFWLLSASKIMCLIKNDP